MRRVSMVVFVLGFLHHSAFAQPGAPQPPPQPYPQPPPQQYNPGQPVQLITPEERDLLIQGEITSEMAVAGGVVGTFIGFGLGHAIQGRYGDVGYLFTLGEVGGFTAMMAGVIECVDQFCDQPPPIFWGGVIALAGFRIWEVVDVWVGPSAHNRKVQELRMRLGYPPPRPAYGLYVAPAKGGNGGKVMGLSLAF